MLRAPFADYKRMLAHLRQPGASLSIQPEGIAGIFLASDTAMESIFLTKRKGFVKLAIQGGAGERPAPPPHLPCPNTHATYLAVPNVPLLLHFVLQVWGTVALQATGEAAPCETTGHQAASVPLSALKPVLQTLKIMPWCGRRPGAGVPPGPEPAADVLGHGADLAAVAGLGGRLLGSLWPAAAAAPPHHHPHRQPHPWYSVHFSLCKP